MGCWLTRECLKVVSKKNGRTWFRTRVVNLQYSLTPQRSSSKGKKKLCRGHANLLCIFSFDQMSRRTMMFPVTGPYPNHSAENHRPDDEVRCWVFIVTKGANNPEE
ncbi:hypothetical protein N7490_008910 [Penicillium lividum]|nr:hypothetical protein N7490_008910 [Penicillium lividum]